MKLYLSDDKFKSDDQIVSAYLHLGAAGEDLINVPVIEEGNFPAPPAHAKAISSQPGSQLCRWSSDSDSKENPFP